MNTRNRCALGGLAIVLSSAWACGDVCTWTGAYNGQWGDNRNWTPRAPYSNDDAIIPPGGVANILPDQAGVCANLTNHGTIYVLGGTFGGLFIRDHADSYGLIVMSNGSPRLYLPDNGGVVNIYGRLDFNQGAVATGSFGGGQLNIKPGGVMNISTSNKKEIWCNVTNEGTLTYDGDALYLGANTNYTSVIGNLGTMNVADGGAINGVGNGYKIILNSGRFEFNGLFPHVRTPVVFSNYNGEVVVNSITRIDELANLTPGGGPLDNSMWTIGPGSWLHTQGHPITEIGPGGWVDLRGAGSGMDGLEWMQRINGRLVMGPGASLGTNPLGTLQVSDGFLHLFPGSRLSVQGSFELGANAVLDLPIIDDSPSGIATLEATANSVLGGGLIAEFQDDTRVNPGDSFTVASIALGGCCELTGAFDYVYAFGATEPGRMVYDMTKARLVLGCAADLDGNGALNIFDFLAFQTYFSDGELAADFSGDGMLNVFDFLAFQTAFGEGC